MLHIMMKFCISTFGKFVAFFHLSLCFFCISLSLCFCRSLSCNTCFHDHASDTRNIILRMKQLKCKLTVILM